MKNSLDNKNDIYNFKKVIDDVIDANLDNRGIVKYISAVVVGINDNNTINVYIPPNNRNTITGLTNKSGEILQTGDSVELCAKNGSVKNSWVAIKHGRGVSGSISENSPIGSIIQYSGDSISNNWLICDGSAVSRTEYSELFNVIGTTYGSGDGSTTFNLPNLKGRVAVGLDITDEDFNELGKNGGSKYLQSHNHSIYPYNDDFNNSSGGQHYGTTYDGSNSKYVNTVFKTENAGTGNSGNLQPYVVINYMIKVANSYSYLEISRASVIDNLENSSATDALSAKQGKVLNDRVNSLNDSYIICWSRENASGGAGGIAWTNLAVSKSKGIRYDISGNVGKFIFDEDGIYAINGYMHWQSMPDGARTFLDVTFNNGGILCPVTTRSQDNQWERADPVKEFTRVYAIKGGCIMNFSLYSSTSWTLLGSSIFSIAASGFIIQKIGEYPLI